VQMNDLIFSLNSLLAHEPRMYAGGNMLMYYTPGNGWDHVSADVFVTFDVARGIRECWKTWEEGGRFADVVFAISSPSTIKEDLGKKMRLYAQLNVHEYYLYDPQRNNQPPLAAYRLVDGQYKLMARLVGVEGYRSDMLGTEVRVIGPWLRVIDPLSGAPVLIPAELEAARDQAESARDQAQAARVAAEARAADEARARREVENAKDAADAALRQALEEVTRLRSALERQSERGS
ncbi:MAG: Uma2 family endonuclease, partial [Chloroflexota bacterium]